MMGRTMCAVDGTECSRQRAAGAEIEHIPGRRVVDRQDRGENCVMSSVAVSPKADTIIRTVPV